MNQETYDQVALPADMVGDQAAYLQEGMVVTLAIHEGMPISIEIPQKVTLGNHRNRAGDERPDRLRLVQAGDAVERRAYHGADPYRGRHPHGGETADGSYVERAKD